MRVDLLCNRPDLPLDAVRDFVAETWGIAGRWQAIRSERDQTWHIADDAGPGFVLKVSHRDEPHGIVAMQVEALAHIARVDPDLAVPHMVPTRDGALMATIAAPDGTAHWIRLLTFVPGTILEDIHREVADKPAMRRAVGGYVARLGLALRGFFHPQAGANRHAWDLGRVDQLAGALGDVGDPALRAACARVLADCPAIYAALARVRHQVIHQDGHQGNLLVDPAGSARVVGVIDFGDMLHGSLLADLVTAADCYLDDSDPVDVLCDVTQGYDAVNPLEEAEIDLVYDMACLRLANTVLVVQARGEGLGGGLKHGAMLRAMQAVGRDGVTRRLRRACGFAVPADGGDPAALLAQREAHLGRIWHFYDTPLHLTRGQGAWLRDSAGTRYLDAYNNVPQVGHSHPHVVRATARQAAALNTNTRYLCDVVAAYAERLLASLPPPLAERFDICAFVNSGSEANDVAAQIARTVTGRQAALVMDDAYHGITATTVDLSPLTAPVPDHVGLLDIPDRYRRPEADAAWYADRAAIGAPAFWMVDTALCSNGVTTAPPGYFEAMAARVHAAGGLVIADEVQAGLGRLGQFWGCAAQGLDSVDVITMGKPVGNGHPLGVVLTRRDIWQEFYAASEVFSTFGGNTVSCAAGMAVLDVIEREGLIAQGNRVGDRLRARLRDLDAPLIGDVRGKGMLTGLEFVTDRATRDPAREATRRIVAAMKDRGVLVGASGKARNALKLRPSFAWGDVEVDIFVDCLAHVLEDL
jgi:4-aminobutyrate aminotransferase-like enzyme/Ser/Thr protein kinase RdoA (MazF antagonist)